MRQRSKGLFFFLSQDLLYCMWTGDRNDIVFPLADRRDRYPYFARETLTTEAETDSTGAKIRTREAFHAVRRSISRSTKFGVRSED